MRGHKVYFNGKIRKIFLNYLYNPFFIWSTDEACPMRKAFHPRGANSFHYEWAFIEEGKNDTGKVVSPEI